MIGLGLVLALSLFASSIDTGPPAHAPLAVYLDTAARSWMKLPDCEKSPSACAVFVGREDETVEAVLARVATTAEQVAGILLDGFDDDLESVDDVPKAGLILMSLAFNESRFRAYVDDGRCNDTTWRKSPLGRRLLKLGSCDGGIAYSLFQIHVYEGVHLYWGTMSGAEWGFRPDPTARRERVAHADDLLADRRLAIVTALHMVRASLAAHAGLCHYTGESIKHCPKGEARINLAIRYQAAHPY
jgi:hypothetical protein